MRKRSLYLFAAFVCGLVSCQRSLEEAIVPNTSLTQLTATTEGNVTRTYLEVGDNGTSSVLWSEDDAISVFIDGDTRARVFALQEGAGTKTGVFQGEGSGSDYLAFYPAAMEPVLSDDDVVRFTLPAEQQYVPGSFENEVFPMLAHASSGTLPFRNLASVLRLSISGTLEVSRIVFRSADPAIKVSGPAMADMDDGLVMGEDALDSLVLNASVQLSESESTHFYLVLPPQTYTGGFTVRVYDHDYYMEKTYTQDFAMQRSRLHKADAFVFQYEDEPDPDAYLTLDKEELAYGPEIGTLPIVVSSNTKWKVTSADSWCSVAPESGEGNATISVQAQANDSSQARQTEITISSRDGFIVRKVVVIQSGKQGDEEEGDWKTLDFYHQSLFMRFTATWCGYCPIMNHSVQMAQEQEPDKIEHLALHGGGSDLQFASVGPLMDQYAIEGFPTGIMDGRALIENYASEYASQLIVGALQETEQTYGTKTGLGISSTLDGRSVDMDVTAYVKEAGQYKLTVVLVEDNIMSAQVDYVDGDDPNYIHNGVARIAVTNILGEAFSMGTNEEKAFHYTVTVPSAYVLQNIRVLAYIHKPFGSQPVIQGGNYGDYYVDNCASALLGATHKVALVGGTGGGDDPGEGTGGDGNEGITPGDDIDVE